MRILQIYLKNFDFKLAHLRFYRLFRVAVSVIFRLIATFIIRRSFAFLIAEFIGKLTFHNLLKNVLEHIFHRCHNFVCWGEILASSLPWFAIFLFLLSVHNPTKNRDEPLFISHRFFVLLFYLIFKTTARVNFIFSGSKLWLTLPLYCLAIRSILFIP